MRLCILLMALLFSPLWGEEKKVVRIELRTVSMSLEKAMEVLAKKEGEYELAQSLIVNHEAKLEDCEVLSTMEGKLAWVRSAREIIYSTECEPAGLGSSPITGLLPGKGVPKFRPYPPMAFETRNVGGSMVMEVTVEKDGETVSLRLADERVKYLSDVKWMTQHDAYGKADVVFPIFNVQKSEQGVQLKSGEMRLYTIYSVRDEKGEVKKGEKVLVFVRARVMK